jgi:hypothetical protein
MRWLRTWPPALWLFVYVGSLLVLMGSQRRDLGGIGLTCLLIALGIAVYLSARPEPGRPSARAAVPVLGGLAVFYIVCAIVASQAGSGYALAGLLAATVPMTAAAVMFATARRHTVAEPDGHQRDVSTEEDGAFPGIGFDDRSPLGDTPEVHDDLSPHDVPVGHPARRRAHRS